MQIVMKKVPFVMVAIALLMVFALQSRAANTKTTVSQVTSAVTLSDDLDYIITSSTPFTGDGIVNITNTEHAVIILDAVKPSKAISSWLKYIQINGQRAVNNNNCQVKLYNCGCIILPYAGGDSFKPLTVYSEKNFEGESCNDFGLENSGGFMNTLTDAKLNNRISSFKLKRGYMVTFSLKPSGRGYSRCFIAAYEDLEVASLPAIMNNSISSYRVFKWYDTGKKQLAAAGGDDAACSALNVTSTYTWGGTSDMSPNVENVPHHIYENYPSPSSLGSCTTSPHMKTNNEPMNTADDPKGKTESVDEVLANWEELMRTGMRLCSPSSWDGSDYTNGTGYIKQFIDSIDARGWRCDIIDLHCYWPEGNFGTIRNWTNSTGRPVWISEWVWGASWNSNGAFANGVTEQENADALKRICPVLNNNDCIERYYYWNGERDPSRLYKSGSLTPAGKYYADMNSGLGYNGKYNYIPKVPTQYDPSDLTVSYDKSTHVATLNWKDYNGEINNSMYIQRRSGKSGQWTTIANIDLQEDAASYTYEDNGATNGCEYCVYVVDGKNKTRRTNIAMAASDDLEAGDGVDVDGTTKYLGGNIILNGNFEMGFNGWLDGQGNTICAPYFEIVKVGGNDDGSYLQAYGNATLNSAQSVNTSFGIKANTDYYFSVASCYMPSDYSTRFGLSKEGSAAMSPQCYINNTTGNWGTQFATFNSGEFTIARLNIQNLGAKGQLDQFLLCELFSSREEAIADGVEKLRQKAEMFKAYNTQYVALNDELTQILATVTQNDEEALNTLNTAVANALTAHEILQNDYQKTYAEKLLALKLYGYENLQAAIAAYENATQAATLIEAFNALQTAIADYLPQKLLTDKIKNPDFKSATGWTTKCGTYTDGDQRQATQDGVSCWNAWWSGIDATDETNTMAIKQDVSLMATSPTHGLYALECKASTEHYCLSDQHGYIFYGDVIEQTAPLTADYLDLNIPVEKRWETLVTAPVYVDDNKTMTIGFEGSKKGSLADAWLEVGKTSGQKNDKREGWWCATDFQLRFSPLYKRTVVANQYGVICLPYAVRPSDGMKFYQIAGISSDYSQLYLEEIEETEPGMSCIYRTTEVDALFYEYGDAVANPSTTYAPGNIRNLFLSSARVPLGDYCVKDGSFVKVVGANSDRPATGNFTGFMRSFTDKNSKAIPVMDSWDGPTMPIIGVTEEEIAKNNERQESGIVFVTLPRLVDGLYTLDGRNVTNSNSSLKAGVYIKVVGGRAYKTIVK